MGFLDGKQGIPEGSSSTTIRVTAVWEAGHTGAWWVWRLIYSCEQESGKVLETMAHLPGEDVRLRTTT